MGYELYEELQEKNQALGKCLTTLRQFGKALADAEYQYRLTLAMKIEELKAKGLKTNYIELIIYGIEPVATKRKERDLAQIDYDANKEAINILKLQIKIIQEQINKEYES